MRMPLGAALVCLAACQPPAEDTPEAAYRAFATAASKGEDAVAFGKLTQASQDTLRHRLAGVAQASGGSMGEDAASLVLRGGRASPISHIELLKMEQDRATLAVTARGQAQEVNLRREGSAWRVEVPRLQGGQP